MNIEQLKAMRDSLSAHIDELESNVEFFNEALEKAKKPEKWEPKGGGWYVDFVGIVWEEPSTDESRMAGLERETEEQAEQAAKAMHTFTRLLAYRDEFCPGYEWEDGKENYFVYCEKKEWKTNYNILLIVAGVVYMTQECAIELVRKLNSGEVEL